MQEAAVGIWRGISQHLQHMKYSLMPLAHFVKGRMLIEAFTLKSPNDALLLAEPVGDTGGGKKIISHGNKIITVASRL